MGWGIDMASTTVGETAQRRDNTLATLRLGIARTGPWLAAAVAFVTTLVAVGRSSVTLVETATLTAATRPLSRLPALLAHTDAVLGPFYVFMHFWLKVSHSLWWMRFPGVLASAATAFFVVLIGKRRSDAVGVVAGLLFAFAPMASRYAEDARPYSFAMFAATFGTWRLLLALDRPTRRNWALYAGSVVLLGLVHLFALLLLGAHAWRARTQLRHWLMATVPALVVLMPLLIYGAVEVNSELSWAERPGLHSLRAFVGELSGSAALTVLFAVLTVVGAVTLWRSDRESARLFLLWLALPPALLFAVSQSHPVFADRYLAFTLPALCLLTAVALTSLRTAVAVGVALLIVGLTVPPQLQLRRHTAHDGIAVPFLVTQLHRLVLPGDGILYEPASMRRMFDGYTTPPIGEDLLLAQTPFASNTLSGRNVSSTVLGRRIAAVDRVWVVRLVNRASTLAIYDDASADLKAFHRIQAIPMPGGSITLWVRNSATP